MPSLREKFNTIIRQLSFVERNRFLSNNPVEENSFIRKYLEGRLDTKPKAPCMYSAKSPELLPTLFLSSDNYTTETIKITGPLDGLCAIKRSKLHLVTTQDNIDFIDEIEAAESTQNPISSVSTDYSGKNINREEKAISDWSKFSNHAYGIATSLYERNPISNETTGDPIADCFGLIAAKGICIMSLADGVNWGEGSRQAARAAVCGSIEYLERVLLTEKSENASVNCTVKLATALKQSILEAHRCIIEVGGNHCTLTTAVVYPLKSTVDGPPEFVVCSCNVGDSLGYVYSKKYGVREFTEQSHDTSLMRDMRDALGALGPVNGTNPELSNLTLALTKVEEGDIIFLTSDGISDNFDPVVGKFGEAVSDESLRHDTLRSHQIPPKRQNKSASELASSNIRSTNLQKETKKDVTRPVYNRSKTVIDSVRGRREEATTSRGSHLPKITAIQRHSLILLRLDDLLSFGINGVLKECDSAKKLCHLLIDFVKMITSARRSLLEQRENYIKVTKDDNGRRRETNFTKYQQRVARKKIVECPNYSCLPGKLDHAAVVAYSVKNCLSDNSSLHKNIVVKAVIETNF